MRLRQEKQCPSPAERTSDAKKLARKGNAIRTASQPAMATSASAGSGRVAGRTTRGARGSGSKRSRSPRSACCGQSGAKKIVVAEMVSQGKMPMLKK